MLTMHAMRLGQQDAVRDVGMVRGSFRTVCSHSLRLILPFYLMRHYSWYSTFTKYINVDVNHFDQTRGSDLEEDYR